MSLLRSLILTLAMLSGPALAARSCDSALCIVEEAIVAMDPAGRMQQVDGVTLLLDGRMNLTTRHQGVSPHQDTWVPVRERVTVELGEARLGYTIDWFNYAHSNQRLREVYDPAGRVLYLDLRNGGGGWAPATPVVDVQSRYRRILPHLLLAELEVALREHPDAVRWHEGLLEYRTPAMNNLTVLLDEARHVVEVGTTIDMPLMGLVPLTWRYRGYRTVDGLVVPAHVEVLLDNRLLKRSRYEVVLGLERTGLATHGFKPPQTQAAQTPQSGADVIVEQVAPGVYFARQIREGFHGFFVELDDMVVAVDAPAGWHEMQQLPPLEWSGTATSAALGERFLEAIRRTVPNKPVGALVLTHHHSDHIGGLSSFVDAGVPIIAGDAAADVALAATSGRAQITRVHGQYELGRGKRKVQLIELPEDNPHARDYLAVYVPGAKVMFLTAFIYPLPEPYFPLEESIEASRWLVRWLRREAPPVEQLLNAHGTGRVEPWQLEWFRLHP